MCPNLYLPLNFCVFRGNVGAPGIFLGPFSTMHLQLLPKGPFV